MNTIRNHSPATHRRNAGGWSATFVAQPFALVRRQLHLWRARQELRQLPDDILRDIGITRADINAATEYAASDPSVYRR